MNAVVADTHAVIWYFFASTRLSATARATLDAAIQSGDPIFVPTIALVEIAYLIEKGRVPPATFDRMLQELADPTGRFIPFTLDLGVADALRGVPRDAIPDMPDRIVTATARHLNCPLVTADQKIQTSGVEMTIR